MKTADIFRCLSTKIPEFESSSRWSETSDIGWGEIRLWNYAKFEIDYTARNDYRRDPESFIYRYNFVYKGNYMEYLRGPLADVLYTRLNYMTSVSLIEDMYELYPSLTPGAMECMYG